MAAIMLPREVVGNAAWMRQSLLVAALAGAGERGAEALVPAATLEREPRPEGP